MKDRKLWEKRLKSLKNYKKASEEAEELSGRLPDARYTGKINEAKLTDSNAGDPMIMVQLIVEDDEEHEGASQNSFLNLGDNSLRFSIATLKRLGYELEGDDPAEILDAVEDLNKSEMRVTFKVKDGYANILGPIEEGEAEESEEESENEESEEETEEETEEESEEETEKRELTEGSKVSWEKDGETRTGTVVEILEEDNIARIKKEDGKVARILIKELSIVEEESEEESEVEEVSEEPEESEEETEEVEEKPKRTQKVTKSKVVKKSPPKKVTKSKQIRRKR